MEQRSVKPVSVKYRPWLWPWWVFGRMTAPVLPGTWLINVFVQRVLRVNSTVPWMVHFTSSVWGDISIGRNVWRSFALSPGCYIQGGNGITIGDDTIFGPGAKIISANHDPGELSKWEKAKPIEIGKRCWIGADAVILPGVNLGDHVIVGAGSVVTKSIPPWSVAVGNPAKVISVRNRESDSTEDSGGTGAQ